MEKQIFKSIKTHSIMISFTSSNQMDPKNYFFSIPKTFLLSITAVLALVLSTTSASAQEYWANYLGLATATVEDQNPNSDFYGRKRTIMTFRHSPGSETEIRQILRNQIQQSASGLRDRKSARTNSEEITSTIDYAIARHYRENFNYYTGTAKVEVQWWEDGSPNDLKSRVVKVEITKADRFQKFTDVFYHLINKMYREMDQNEIMRYRPAIDIYDEKGRKVFDYYF